VSNQATFLKLDVSKEDEWQRVIAASEDAFGPVTVLVNNAGVGIFKLLEELTVDDFRLTFEIDELGVFLGMQAVVPSMKKAGHGSIVNISSVSGLRGAPTGSAYCSSKHAVTGMTKAAASELGQFNIRVNSLHPGTIDTAMAGQDDVANYVEELKKTVPLRRAGGVEEISDLCVYLASNRSSYSTGGQFVADGGMICDL
jgi:3alpha(or 20beta)-hydroxysteroid dehydrogenase